jgi:hypothetical protein
MFRPVSPAAHDEVGQAALARTVGAQQGVDFAGEQGQFHVPQHLPPVEAQRDMAQFQERHVVAGAHFHAPATCAAGAGTTNTGAKPPPGVRKLVV